RGGLADSLRPERVVRRGRGGLVQLPVRRLHRGGNEIVHEASALDVAVLVVGDLLEERGRHAHREAAVDLPVDDHGIDDVAAVVHGDEPTDLHHARAAVDVDYADVAAEGEGEVG